jgi:hypothetical protein
MKSLSSEELNNLTPEESEKIRRYGLKAASLLNDQMFVDLLSEVEGETMREILASSPEEMKKREDAYFTLKGMQKVINHLKNYMNHAMLISRMSGEEPPTSEENNYGVI